MEEPKLDTIDVDAESGTSDARLHTIDVGALWKAEWIEERDRLIVASGRLATVEDQGDLDLAGKVVSACARHRKVLSRARLDITRQIDALKKTIMGQEKDLADAMTAEENRLRALSSEYLTEQSRIQREAEAEAEMQRRQAAQAQAAADEKARAVFGANAETSVVNPVTPAPAPPEKVKPSTASAVERWDYEIIEPLSIPRIYLEANSKAIRATIKAVVAQGLKPQIEGLRIFSTVEMRARG